ncbi:glycoside hydrolase family 31 protein [Alicyclobacillus ferrooxydans]|uniref:Alpha-glucosidase n=1 Tax=Alicyclobacillus ferrooxydans TaxID=471514 RepID=A0A0P9CTI0_9BACL|nr:TIM-barrel domain-containing protein [Alicyclobacillus ferrooxydans]KPV42959.1 alpha-glucosidase [Alicyclobacillus ferrooxydans]
MESSESIHPDKNTHASGRVGSEHKLGQVIGYVTDAGSSGKVHRFYTPDGNFAVRFLNHDTIRIKMFSGDDVDWSSTQAVEPVASFADLENAVTVDVLPEESVITLATETLRVVVWKYPFSLQVFTKDGTLVYKTDSVWIDKSGSVKWIAQSDETEHFYGLGEKTSFLDKRGERYEMWNSDVYAPHVPEIEALYESIPLLLHMRETLSYGVFLDNPGRTVFDMRSRKDAYTIQTSTGDLDLYIFFGPSIKQVIEKYTGLTGRMPLPPKWALGYHQSRYSYMDQEEVLELARTFRAKQIPCDVIHLDIHYMEGYRVFTFDQARFPDPKAMMTELAEMGFHIVPIVDPGVKRDPRYPIYKEGIAGNFFCKTIEGTVYTGDVWPGESAFPDFTSDNVAAWWGEKQRFYTDLGIRGIWNDMNEPAIFNEIKTMEPHIMHDNNGNPKTHAELHNLYGMLMSKATYEGLRSQVGEERPFVLTRAGYSGVQRYAAVWTGDNRSFWEHMAMAMPMVLNLGLSGVTFSGPDVGGFAHHTTGELLTRWTQMGAFFPFFRNHSALDTLRQEPWAFDEPYETIIRDYTNWRYRWMPHLYSLFYGATQTGVPVVRPLVLEYPSDPRTTNISDQFLLGEGILVAPIYRPDTTARSVYLPEGVWYDYWTGQRYNTPGHILADAPLDKIPMYIKAGTVIAEQPVVQHHVNGSPVAGGQLLFRVYAGNLNGSSVYTFYEDDGFTFAHEQGEYNLWEITVNESGAASGAGGAADGNTTELRIEWNRRQDGYNAGRAAIDLQIHQLSFEPSTVDGLNQVSSVAELASAPTGWHYDSATHTLYVKAADDVASLTVR